METYDKVVQMQLLKFERELYKKSEWKIKSKRIQEKIDRIIPGKVHQTLAKALEKAIKSYLQGLTLLPSSHLISPSLSAETNLHERTEEGRKIIKNYKKLASVEGAGTGFGGLLASSVDFPALVSIKLKLLQELLVLFGHQLQGFEERVYTLKIFLLQFSGHEAKQRVWQELKHWEQQVEYNEWESWEAFDWEEFYLEYRQSIELRKLLQIIPGFGAIVGAWANYTFLDDLGHTALRCLQLRYLQQKYGQSIVD